MATTSISDVIVPSVFNPYVIERTAELAGVYLGGIVENNPELDTLAESGGLKLQMPFWKDLSGADDNLSDSTPLVPAALTSGQDTASLLTRGKAWSVNDLAKSLSGDDPLAAIGNLVAEYWVRKYQAVLVSNLTGIMLDNVANDGGDMVNSIFIEAGNSATASNIVSSGAIIATAATMGDKFQDLSGIAMHSDVYFNLLALDSTAFTRESEQGIMVERYKGLRVIIDDGMPARAGTTNGTVYTTALFGQGAFGLGIGGAPVPTETDRDALGGNDILVNRSHFLLHPRGIASTAADRPTNAQLAVATSHNRVYERKNVRMAFLLSNG
jgi:hypothetical protein